MSYVELDRYGLLATHCCAVHAQTEGSSRMYGFIQGQTIQPSNQLEFTSWIDEMNNRFSTKPIERNLYHAPVGTNG
jgi:hypothetical protein